jgi:hypothetical protein
VIGGSSRRPGGWPTSAGGACTSSTLDSDHRVYAITRIALDRQGRAVEVNLIVMPAHQWTLAYAWPAE